VGRRGRRRGDVGLPQVVAPCPAFFTYGPVLEIENPD
jgi:hypothetical protein